jgi:pimeloyl-ACP methyl ester carboxylesterase
MYDRATQVRLRTGEEVPLLVRNHGSTRRTLLLHGNPGSILDWEHLIPHLADATDVAALDLPGFGRSPPAANDALTLTRAADRIIAVADALSWEGPLFLVGHSHGGGVAQIAAARHPDRVAGLVLLGTLGFPAHASYRLLSLPGAEWVTRAGGRLFRSRAFRPASRWLLRRVMRDIFWPEPVTAARVERELEQFSTNPEILTSMVRVTLDDPCAQLLDAAVRIRCPILFLHGQHDALVPIECARSIHRRVERGGGQSHFEVLPHAGHMLVEFQAQAVGERIRHFFRAQELRTTA